MKLRLRDLRAQKGWTIDRTVEETGLSRGFISQLETGKRQASPDTLQALADAFGVPITALIDVEDDADGIGAILSDLVALDPESLHAVAQIVRAMRLANS